MFRCTKSADPVSGQGGCIRVIDPAPFFPANRERHARIATLAQTIAETRESDYLDLESLSDRDKLIDPVLYLSGHEDKLVILYEVQRTPELFAALRGLIDAGRRRGRTSGRFLVLGSASARLLRQSETLAGRIAYIEMSPLDVLETPDTRQTDLWVRGGF